MATVTLKNVYKVYDNNIKLKKNQEPPRPAVSDFCMDIADKEFIVFVGPSGCGKSTTLRMIAGLEEITSGEIYIDDALVNEVEPKDRDIAMVFQNYALYPHMSVFKNMAFGLELRKLPKDEIDHKVHEAAKILDIEEYLDRKPKALSGGQRQRVALGRAIVRNPKVFLLDEPLSNLDAKLRASMRTEIIKLHDRLQTTFIYVTHDQVEAMTMGTRIVVMKDGFIQQIGSPQYLYDHPANKFVAGFIGTPQMNFFDGILLKEGVVTFANGQRITLSQEKLATLTEYEDGTPVTLGIRPEDIYLAEKDDKNTVKCKINVLEELGSETIIYADLNVDSANVVASEGSAASIVVKTGARTALRKGEEATFTINVKQCHLFGKADDKTLENQN